MEQPDGAKQADREAEQVADEDRAQFQKWMQEQRAKESVEAVRAIADSSVDLDPDNDPVGKRNGRMVARTADGPWEALPEWPHRTLEHAGATREDGEAKPMPAVVLAT